MLAGFETPQKVFSSDGVQAYLSHTQNFSGKESMLQIGLISELPIKNRELYGFWLIDCYVYSKK